MIGLIDDDGPSECLACGSTWHDQDAVMTYHWVESGLIESDMGHLCSVCRRRVNMVLSESFPEECNRCAAPFPEANRHELVVYDEYGLSLSVTHLCVGCVGDL